MQSDILIAGAGLSGLALALALQDKGLDWQLYEARPRPGGRILTLESDIDGVGTTLTDIGPSWIWPGQARVESLLRRFELEVFEQYSSGRLVYQDELGQVRRDLDFSTMAGALRVAGGLSRLTRAIADQLPAERLHLAQGVSAIEDRRQGYRVTLGRDPESQQVDAGQVVLAIPPRVIAAGIRFIPPLPDQAIRSLEAIPTWMAGHAKLVAIYADAFWRDQGLSGDAISRLGPLVEIHDASPRDAAYGALFGFVGLPAGSPLREPARLAEAASAQLGKLFGPVAARPLDIQIVDWARDPFTATPADAFSGEHPAYGFPAPLAALAARGLVMASTEVATGSGGFIEGALEASEYALTKLS